MTRLAASPAPTVPPAGALFEGPALSSQEFFETVFEKRRSACPLPTPPSALSPPSRFQQGVSGGQKRLSADVSSAQSAQSRQQLRERESATDDHVPARHIGQVAAAGGRGRRAAHCAPLFSKALVRPVLAAANAEYMQTMLKFSTNQHGAPAPHTPEHTHPRHLAVIRRFATDGHARGESHGRIHHGSSRAGRSNSSALCELLVCELDFEGGVPGQAPRSTVRTSSAWPRTTPGCRRSSWTGSSNPHMTDHDPKPTCDALPPSQEQQPASSPAPLSRTGPADRGSVMSAGTTGRPPTCWSGSSSGCVHGRSAQAVVCTSMST